MARIVKDRELGASRKKSFNLVFRICVCLRAFALFLRAFCALFWPWNSWIFDPGHLKRSTGVTDAEE